MADVEKGGGRRLKIQKDRDSGNSRTASKDVNYLTWYWWLWVAIILTSLAMYGYFIASLVKDFCGTLHQIQVVIVVAIPPQLVLLCLHIAWFESKYTPDPRLFMSFFIWLFIGNVWMVYHIFNLLSHGDCGHDQAIAFWISVIAITLADGIMISALSWAFVFTVFGYIGYVRRSEPNINKRLKRPEDNTLVIQRSSRMEYF